MSAWIADHMENLVLHGLKTYSCHKCRVLLWILGNDAKYSARDCAEYKYCQRENKLNSPGSESDDDDADVTFDTLWINMGPGVVMCSTEFRPLICSYRISSIPYILDYSST